MPQSTNFAFHFNMQTFKEQIDNAKLPKHIAIIMDGNGRWAQQRGEDRLFGHYEGVKSVRNMVEACGEIGIEYLTLYAFSTENWNRPEVEVEGLMELLVNTIRKEIDDLHKNGVRLHVIGDIASLPASAQKELAEAREITKNNKGLNLVMALSYSGRWEIINAIQNIMKDVKSGKINSEMMDVSIFESYLNTSHIPDPELLIRTGGDNRISNFLLFQIAYAELYFTETHWPEFRKENLYQAILEFQNRERRFGKTSDQIQAKA